MAKYLVDEKVLVGRTKDDVSDLLGKACRNGIFVILYNLGAERGSLFAVDNDWLEITFAGTPDNLIVTNTRIRPD